MILQQQLKNELLFNMQIQLGGQLRSLEFNNLALEVFTKHTDYETSRADLYACIYAGLRGFAYAENPRALFPFTFRDVINWCDEAEEDDLVKAYNEFTETNAFKKWYAKFQDLLRSKLSEADEEKKSQITT
jgi:hypothetical protein